MQRARFDCNRPTGGTQVTNCMIRYQLDPNHCRSGCQHPPYCNCPPPPTPTPNWGLQAQPAKAGSVSPQQVGPTVQCRTSCCCTCKHTSAGSDKPTAPPSHQAVKARVVRKRGTPSQHCSLQILYLVLLGWWAGRVPCKPCASMHTPLEVHRQGRRAQRLCCCHPLAPRRAAAAAAAAAAREAAGGWGAGPTDAAARGDGWAQVVCAPVAGATGIAQDGLGMRPTAPLG